MKEVQGISRVTRPRPQARLVYDQISGLYDMVEGNWEGRARLVGLTKLAVKPGEIVLEIGVGPGHDLVALARATGTTGRAYGVDISPRMLARSQTRLGEWGVSGHALLTCGDGLRLNFKSGCFDALYMSFTLELFDTPEIPQMLAECRRVLRPTGRIGIVALSQAGPSTWRRRLYSWGHDHFPLYLDCRPIFVQQALEAASFRSPAVTRLSLWGLPVEVVVAKKTRLGPPLVS
jgi:demethylmenaquinone methyltransferase/2-methoxy-6-polyprenyl-1,4-benzoquinol methylase